MTANQPRCNFQLDPQLEQDTTFVARLQLCRILLMEDARYPWTILVPARPAVVEIIDLCDADRAQLFAEICLVSQAFRQLFLPHKLNVAALGNQVRQLHVHVIARQADDPAWPGPVWGVGASDPYDDQKRLERIGSLDAALASVVGSTPD